MGEKTETTLEWTAWEDDWSCQSEPPRRIAFPDRAATPQFRKQPVTVCRSAENVPCYIELADANQEVQPDPSIGILEGFRLVDEESPVTLEFTGGFDKSGQKFMHTFTLR